MSSENMVNLAIFRGDPQTDIPEFVDRCSSVGVKKIFPSFYAGVVKSHDSVLAYRTPGEKGAEARGPFQVYPYGEKNPIRSLVKHSRAAGIEVHPYILAAFGGMWWGSRRAVPRAYMQIGRMYRFASEHPEYFTKAQDGRSWLDFDIGEEVLGYPLGYLSQAYPQVREYDRSALVEYVREYGVVGVQLEFSTVLAGGQEVWPLGYDEPAIKAYKNRFGIDPREIDNADEEWTRLRAGYVTQFVRELRGDLSNLGVDVEISVATEGVWADPSGAYKLMVDWPTWVEEGLIDVLYPRFWTIDPQYPLSYPLSDTGSWQVTSSRIGEEMSKVQAVVGDKCQVYGTLIFKNGGGTPMIDDLANQMTMGAKAVVEAGATGFGVYTDHSVMDTDVFWDTLKRISSGDF